MAKTVILFLSLMLCISSVCLAEKNPDLSDLGGLTTIEKLMRFDSKGKTWPEQLYFVSLRDKIKQAPVNKRADVLNTLAKQTKWGTYQRFIAYYVCAWYGVSYIVSRNYLIHAAFWWEWKIGSSTEEPFCFQDLSIDFLYALYEHNHDFQILHDILTTKGDAAIGEIIVCLTQDAIVKHPRGVLHIADISAKGYDIVYKLLHLPPCDENNPIFILCSTEDSLKAFSNYITRVANDKKDPLSSLAKDLLHKPVQRLRKSR